MRANYIGQVILQILSKETEYGNRFCNFFTQGETGFFVVVYQQGMQNMHAGTEVYNTEMSFSPIYLFCVTTD